MTPVRLKPAALQSRVKHSTTEPLRYLCQNDETAESTRITNRPDIFQNLCSCKIDITSVSRFFFIHQHISQRAAQTSLEKQLDPKGPNCFLRGSVLIFLSKPLATCDFPRGIWTPFPHMDPPMNILLGSQHLFWLCKLRKG